MTETTRELRVEGMTCDHCVRAVTAELSAVENVTAVSVDLRAGATSAVRVTTSGPVDDRAVAAAIDEAGYTLA
ncbi:heavy-metal-associated domain-containing protein [Microbacterium sp. HMH0099]|uniref:heavy-metal-associated domain-containing protein n=1 Tax=Microbacterium sp. HMH0099 TaxID=3414026 RepID=UPI003BF69C57